MRENVEGGCVLFLDSGIGGIPYFSHFRQRNPDRALAYLADRANFPYGKRGRDELVSILSAVVEKITPVVEPEIIVLACNSASIAALAQLRERFSQIPFVGTVPAVKPAVLASKTGKIVVLGTEFTVREAHIKELGAKYGNREIVGIAAPDLVRFVENRLDVAGQNERKEIVSKYMRAIRETGADALVLGCTHFLFLLDDFRREATPDIAVFESVHGITARVESLLHEKELNKNGGASKSEGSGYLLLTGTRPPESAWEKWASRLDCRILLPDLF